jgi:cysteinyl-tRNA synthetase
VRIFNTMTHEKEEFVPLEEGKVSFYVCGPTVYNHIHIGNARTFVSFDVIRRYLLAKGYDVRYVSNITDVDDKIINRALEEGRSASEVAREYTAAFERAMLDLGVMPPTVRPKATEEIDEMVGVIAQLVENGHAYPVEGDVYFRVRSFSDYGKLSGRAVDDMLSGARIDIDTRKEDPLDFALWKAAKPGEPSWASPWGAGRPGWHIECSCMSRKYLGMPFDIHGGGADLVFPHHENEIAQAESCFGVPFAHYWMHGGMLLIDKEKMSKSLGNFLLLKDVLKQTDRRVLRLLMLQTHYRSPLDYSCERIDEAAASYDRIRSTLRNTQWAMENADISCECDAAEFVSATSLQECIARTRLQFFEAMDDDFNTAGALGAVFTLIACANTFLVHGIQCDEDMAAARTLIDTTAELMGILGIDLSEEEQPWPSELIDLAQRLLDVTVTTTDAAAEALLEGRRRARASKDWDMADAIRKGLIDLGFIIEDTACGARIHFDRR